ncbi:DUF222 domain-containing protein [Citricoccus sp. GCM10030269]|uniref:HNH endonuclease signature motif containing protein n=1 Tax=Citricoccus sp. GCM10030269 TaxID=3273388 RepID=UPI0036211588
MVTVNTDELSSVSTAALLSCAQTMAAELAARATDPEWLNTVESFQPGADHDGDGALDRSGEWGMYAGADSPGHHDLTSYEGHADVRPVDEGSVDEEGDGRTDDAGTGDAGIDATPPEGSLPMVQLGVEQLARSVDAIRTALAGHTDRLFDQHETRQEILGIAPGKCAYRNAAEYLQEHLRIHRREAQRRIRRAGQVMATKHLDQSGTIAPKMPFAAEVVDHGQADVSAVDMVVETLTSARQDASRAGAPGHLVDQLLHDGEQVLVAQARDVDPQTLKKICAYWRQRFDAVADPDGTEPTEAQANAAQGLFYHGRGEAELHRWSLLATDAQHEVLKTVVSAASNPRRTEQQPGEGSATWGEHVDEAEPLDGRSRAQRELDGLVSALSGALALVRPSSTRLSSTRLSSTRPGSARAGSTPRGDQDSTAPHRTCVQPGTGNAPPGADAALPGADAALPGADAALPGAVSHVPGAAGLLLPDVGGGGARPQVLVTIDYETLSGQLANASGHPTDRLLASTAYGGPVNPQTIRTLACDADLIPVVLGGQGEVLDVGRSQRLFSRKLRRAITARDGGCAAPACSIPAPWCEVHHIEHWEHGGPTSVENGVMLCSHHHHTVHNGAWRIDVRGGIPWFIPARYHDPYQRPRRNLYWRPGDLPEAA